MKSNDSTINPADDGLKFINIYTKGATRLGRLMTNLADVPTYHPDHGMFRTGEGLWYYLRTGCNNDAFRALSGFEAKRLGMSMPRVWRATFVEEIKTGIRHKVENHQELKELLIESTLPFQHYYCYGTPPNHKVVDPKNVRWLTEFWTELRQELKQ